ncbi:MAG: integrase arm-type DNA-binding domain-containing protein [Filomicrobium sp.]
MAGKIHKLTARGVKAANKAGRLGDGGNLYLNVANGGTKSWVFVYRRRDTKKLVELGLGSAKTVTLAEARSKAAALRKQLSEGIDPKAERTRSTRRTIPTFARFASEFIEDQKTGWRNEKHRHQWSQTIETYCAPIADLPVNTVTQADVLSILKPIWQTKAETASRLRGRIEKILDAAKARGLRDGENPARWKGHLQLLLPQRQKLQRGHHAAMPYQDVPTFFNRLANLNSVSAKALQFIILTTVRSGCVLRSKRDGIVHGMRWEEVDFDNALWEVPAQRMKSGKDFRVPLSPSSIAILEYLQGLDVDFVFPGQREGTPLSEMACELVMRRLAVKPATVHGFRTSFRCWVAECTDSPDWVAEMSLAHVVGNAVERAYQRSDVLERRRNLIEDWANYVTSADT